MEKKKIVSIEDRIPKLKQVRKKKANQRLIFYLSIFFILISIIIYLQSSLSDIKNIVVKGNHSVSNEEVIEQSLLTTQTNIWTIKQEKIKDIIGRNPIISSVEVNRQLPWTVEITIEEFDRVGYIKTENQFYPVLENGTTLSNATSFIGDAPIIEGFTDELLFNNMVGELQKMSKSILNLISEIHWQPTNENQNKIMLYMNDGFIVNSTIRNFADKMQIYPSIVAQLEPGSEGIIHIGVGAYFETYHNDENEEIETENEE